MEDYRMIITPKELNQQKKDLLIVDIRPSKQRNEIPLNGLNSISCENDEVSNIQEKKVLVSILTQIQIF